MACTLRNTWIEGISGQALTGLSADFDQIPRNLVSICMLGARWRAMVNRGVACVCAKWCVSVYFAGFCAFLCAFLCVFSCQNGLQKSTILHRIVQKTLLCDTPGPLVIPPCWSKTAWPPSWPTPFIRRGRILSESVLDQNGPKWSKRWFWSKWPFAEPDFSIHKTKTDRNGPFWPKIGGWQKGGFQKGGLADVPPERKPERGYIRMFSQNENRNEGMFACSPRTKTGTRVHSPKPPFYETALLSHNERKSMLVH